MYMYNNSNIHSICLFSTEIIRRVTSKQKNREKKEEEEINISSLFNYSKIKIQIL